MDGRNTRLTQRIGFLLVPGFALMSYASATEPLRAANLIAGRPLYEVQTLSIDGEPVASSSGALVPCIAAERARTDLHTVFVCAGGHPGEWHHPRMHAVLRQFAHHRVRLGGISGGPYLLAAAGLLNGRDFTIHWEHAPALIEAFPHLAPRQARFVLDGDRITCGGGVAPLDMMHALIGQRMGEGFARRVSDWFLHTAVAEPAAPQRASIAERFGVHQPALLVVLEKMEATIERPLGRAALAALAGISPRHLDRLFRDNLKAGFLETYRRIRLEHARRLLLQSPLTISEIAFATGFSSAGHFSRAYRAVYGQSPRQSRSAKAAVTPTEIEA